jgi:microcystin-dependent protein
MDPYIGEIRLFAGNFAPRGWALCNGQIMAIASNTALFSILGTNYGGNGTTTFGLPNLQAGTAIGQGSGPGLTPRQVGETGGSPNVTLTIPTMPSHNHTFTGEQAQADNPSPIGNFVAVNRNLSPYTAPGASGLNVQPMNPMAVGVAGGGQPHNNMQPYLGLNYIIALQGVFPPRS